MGTQELHSPLNNWITQWQSICTYALLVTHLLCEEGIQLQCCSRVTLQGKACHGWVEVAQGHGVPCLWDLLRLQGTTAQANINPGSEHACTSVGWQATPHQELLSTAVQVSCIQLPLLLVWQFM
jgi:hypothetical protein